jgi:hypothetical protein
MKVDVRNYNGRLREVLVGSIPSIDFIQQQTGKKCSPLMTEIHHETMEDLGDLNVVLRELGIKVKNVDCQSFDEELNLGQSMVVVDDCVLTSWPNSSMQGYGLEDIKTMSPERPFYFNGDNLLLTEKHLIFGRTLERWHIESFRPLNKTIKIIPSYNSEIIGFVSKDLCLSYESAEKTRMIYDTLENIDLLEYYPKARDISREWDEFTKAKTQRCLTFDSETERQSLARFFLSGAMIDLIDRYKKDMKNLFEERLFDCRFIVVDRNTIISNTKNKKLIEILNKKGVDVVHTNWRHGIFFDTSLRQLVLPTKRDAE